MNKISLVLPSDANWFEDKPPQCLSPWLLQIILYVTNPKVGLVWGSYLITATTMIKLRIYIHFWLSVYFCSYLFVQYCASSDHNILPRLLLGTVFTLPFKAILGCFWQFVKAEQTYNAEIYNCILPLVLFTMKSHISFWQKMQAWHITMIVFSVCVF